MSLESTDFFGYPRKMVSEIVKYYLQSTFRKRLLGEIVDEEEEEYDEEPEEEDDGTYTTIIYIEWAEIHGGRPEDDETIIDFLSGLGNVDVDVVIDDYSLKFEPGTFDNWFPRDLFKLDCVAWYEDYEFYDDPTICRCYYDFEKARITSTITKNGIYAAFSPINVLFEIQGGLKFPRFQLTMSKSTKKCMEYFQKCFRNLRSSGVIRRQLIPEIPIYMDNLAPVYDFPTRYHKALVINARYDGAKIDITQTIGNEWMSRMEALDYIKTKAEQKDYVSTGDGTFNSKYLHDIDISNIDNIGVVHSKYDIYLQYLDGAMEAEEILRDVYRDRP